MEERMELLLRQLFERRLEILAADFFMHFALNLLSLAIIAIYITAVVTGKDEICEFIPVLVLSLLAFVVVRGDFMIHRPGSYIRYVESELPAEQAVTGKSGQPIMGWETFKSSRQNGWVVGVTDAVGSLVILFVLYKGQTRLWNNDEHGFVVITTLLILVVAAFIPKIPGLAGR